MPDTVEFDLGISELAKLPSDRSHFELSVVITAQVRKTGGGRKKQKLCSIDWKMKGRSCSDAGLVVRSGGRARNLTSPALDLKHLYRICLVFKSPWDAPRSHFQFYCDGRPLSACTDPVELCSPMSRPGQAPHNRFLMRTEGV